MPFIKKNNKITLVRKICYGDIMRDEAIITPSVLRWARESIRISLADAAQDSGYQVTTIQQWEEGQRKISMAQLRILAKIYKLAITTFYLPEPPAITRRTLIDRRILPGTGDILSPELQLLIDSLEIKQGWLSQFIKDSNRARIAIGPFDIRTPIDNVVSDIKAKLRINIVEQIATKEPREALNLWIEKAESFGINIVSKSSGLALDEFRAFVLYDDYAPFICLNSKDTPAARLFSLCHEMTHLWLKESVLSNKETYETNDRVEAFCNEVASRLLIEDAILLSLWRDVNPSLELSDKVKRIANKFSVSEEVVARCLNKKNKISREEYQELRSFYAARWAQIENTRTRSKGGPVYSLKMVLENGRYFSRQVLSQYDRGTLYGAEASRLLGVKINHFGSLKDHLPPFV